MDHKFPKGASDLEVTGRLAQWVCESEFRSVPDAVRREAARTLLNWMGCAVGGSRHESVDIALQALGPFMGKPQASVLGRTERVDALHAALLNGLGSHVLDFDDTHLRTIIHPAGPVAAALLALAEHRPVSGGEFLHALILGVEVECRIGNAVYPDHYDAGWHITATAGVFGAAAAAGCALGLDRRRMCWALGAAATQAAGLREMFGTMCKPFHVGRAAQNGLSAALLAARGFTSSERAIEAPRGFAPVLSAKQDYGAICEGLGDGYEIARNTYKPYPCGVVVHPSLDGCIRLKREHGITAGDVEAVELRVHPLVLELTGNRTPRTGLEGKFSVYHAAAAALALGRVGVAEFSDETVNHPEITALRGRVSAAADGAVNESAAVVRIRLKGGRSVEASVEHASGSLERPLSDRALEDKVHALADPLLGPASTREMIEACRNAAQLEDASVLASAATPGRQAARPSPPPPSRPAVTEPGRRPRPGTNRRIDAGSDGKEHA